MGLISKTVKMRWGSRNKKYFEDQGYKFTKMGDEFEVKVEDLTKGSHIKVKCICDGCGDNLSWQYRDYIRCIKDNGKTYCKKCGINSYRREEYLQHTKSFEEWCIENDRQYVLNRWDYESNDCKPSEICYSTYKKYWFKCDKHPEHKSELKSISRFVMGQSGAMECKQCKSLAQWMIDNDLKIEDCWDYDKNFLNPWEINYGNNDKKVWWKCLDGKHEDYLRTVNKSIKYNFRCPQCSQERKESIGEEKVRLYLKEELGYKVSTEHNCTLKPINPKTKQPLPYDNEVILDNGKHLIIEVHGSQHYNLPVGAWIDKDKTPEQQLHYQQLKDRYKRVYAIQNMYEYLEIPYWAINDKKDTYKKLIDDKIKEILNKNY